MGQRWKAERSTIQRTAGQGYERSAPGENGVAGGPSAHEKMRKLAHSERARGTPRTRTRSVTPRLGKAVGGRPWLRRLAALFELPPLAYGSRVPGSGGSRGPQRGRGSPGQGLVRPPRPGVAPALLRALSSVRSRPTEHACLQPKARLSKDPHTGEAESVGTARGPGERGSERNVPGVSEARRGARGARHTRYHKPGGRLRVHIALFNIHRFVYPTTTAATKHLVYARRCSKHWRQRRG